MSMLDGKSDSSPGRASINGESSRDVEKVEGDQDSQVNPQRKIVGVKWALFVVSILTALFLYGMDNTVVANIQPTIVNHFQSVDELPWLAVGFMIGGVSIILPIGKLFLRFNNKNLFIFFSVNFFAGSALCAGAPNMPAEIVGRVWAGAGGNGMYYGLINLMSSNTLERERPTYMSFTGIIWGLGTVLGPIIGGALQLVSWRWAFWLIVIFAAPLLPAYFFLIPADEPAPGISTKQKLLGFDWIGTVLIASSLTLFIVATNFGGLRWPWNSGSTIALYVVSGLSFVAFMIQQCLRLFTTPEAQVCPVHLLRNKEVMLLLTITACGGTMAYASIYYVPLYFQFTRGDTPVQTAARVLPFICLFIFSMLLNGSSMSKFGYYKPWYVFGTASGLVGSVLLSTISTRTSNSAVYGYQALVGLGTGCFVQAGFSVVQAQIEPEDAVHGLMLMMFGQLSGITFGLSIAGATFINLAVLYLSHGFPNVGHETLVQTVSGTSGSILHTLSQQEQQKALEAIVKAMHGPFIQAYSAGAVGFILTLFLKWKKVY